MAAQTNWVVVFYTDKDGKDLINRFLEGLDLQTQARFEWSIEQLRVRNVLAREPLVRHIEGKIYELRRESNTNIYRLFYSFLSQKRILILHGFQKKTQKTPRREIEIALKRLNSFIEKEGE